LRPAAPKPRALASRPSPLGEQALPLQRRPGSSSRRRAGARRPRRRWWSGRRGRRSQAAWDPRDRHAELAVVARARLPASGAHQAEAAVPGDLAQGVKVGRGGHGRGKRGGGAGSGRGGGRAGDGSPFPPTCCLLAQRPECAR
jgi:hypothetical protein